jgi:hypothetical protein
MKPIEKKYLNLLIDIHKLKTITNTSAENLAIMHKCSRTILYYLTQVGIIIRVDKGLYKWVEDSPTITTSKKLIAFMREYNKTKNEERREKKQSKTIQTVETQGQTYKNHAATIKELSIDSVRCFENMGNGQIIFLTTQQLINLNFQQIKPKMKISKDEALRILMEKFDSDIEIEI